MDVFFKLALAFAGETGTLAVLVVEQSLAPHSAGLEGSRVLSMTVTLEPSRVTSKVNTAGLSL